MIYYFFWFWGLYGVSSASFISAHSYGCSRVSWAGRSGIASFLHPRTGAGWCQSVSVLLVASLPPLGENCFITDVLSMVLQGGKGQSCKTSSNLALELHNVTSPFTTKWPVQFTKAVWVQGRREKETQPLGGRKKWSHIGKKHERSCRSHLCTVTYI